MGSTGAGGSLPPNFLLTPQQQSLLFAALNSNRGSQNSAASAKNALTLETTPLKTSPARDLDNTAFNESPYLDNYDYDFGDSSFDFSFANRDQNDSSKMIGDIPDSARSDSTEGEMNEKRSHPDDEDDEDSPEKDAKRHEGSEKVPKKPGRKPLTSEPSSKRKAQNRAAQRAFRERKEKHLKDLETKVEELEKASEATNNENSLLRAQVDRMNTELKQYKQKIALMSNSPSKPTTAKEKVGFGKPALSNLGDINFQFEFPKFGMLPGPPQNKPQRSVSQPISPAQGQSPARSQSNDNSAASQHSAPNPHNGWSSEDVAKFSSIYSPSMKTSVTNGSRASLDSVNLSSFGGNTSSPSASSNSNAGPTSSCGTSPEPFTQSPMGFKPVETMTTIGEEQSTVPSSTEQPFAQFSNIDVGNLNSFDWLAQQHGGQFDPQLFGDYREPQDNILANPTFDDLFNDSVDADFFTPYNIAPNLEAPKLNLIDEIDAKQNAVEEDVAPKKENMNCNQIWEKLQACPNAQSGDFDLDGLCSELTKKAKCSGSGPVVGESDFDTILKKYMGKDVSTECVASKLGIEVDRNAKPNAVSNP